VSDAGRAYVIKHSPYKGARFTIHYMIGDVANDMHANRFWMALGKLAAKARTSRQTASEAMKAMCDDGFLHRVSPEDEGPLGRPVEYEFLMPDVPVAYEEVSSHLTPKMSSQTTPGIKPDDTQVSSELTHNQRNNQRGTELDLSLADQFDTFYDEAYPRKVGRPKAFIAFKAAVKRGVEPGLILLGAYRFRDDPNRDDAYTPHPTTWLHREGWNDGPLPARNGHGNGSGKRTPADMMREAAAMREAGL
jgi:hypothetical protein